jgi:hypothetical protein
MQPHEKAGGHPYLSIKLILKIYKYLFELPAIIIIFAENKLEIVAKKSFFCATK